METDEVFGTHFCTLAHACIFAHSDTLLYTPRPKRECRKHCLRLGKHSVTAANEQRVPPERRPRTARNQQNSRRADTLNSLNTITTTRRATADNNSRARARRRYEETESRRRCGALRWLHVHVTHVCVCVAGTTYVACVLFAWPPGHDDE